jgi:methionyl-tRNA synthetase
MPFASDGSVTWESVFKRYNGDLVNNLGNLVKRTLDMQNKYFDRVICAPAAREPIDGELLSLCLEVRDRVYADMDSYHVADAVAEILRLLDRANKYIDETTPWVLARDEANRERLGTVLYNLLCAIRWAALLLVPFIPDAAGRILGMLGCLPAGEILFDELLSDASVDALVPGEKVGASEVLFARIDEKKLLEEIEAERQAALAAAEAQKAPEKPEGCAVIGIEDFMKVELRVARILSAEPVPKAKKLLRLEVDLGYEKRQIVSGIAKFYKPDQLVGKKVAVVANLAPATLCGVESQGMLLASGEETVRVIFLDPETPLGERIR